MKKALQRVDRVEIITLVDNVIENAGSRTHECVAPVYQWVTGKSAAPRYTLAGHGLAHLIRTYLGGEVFEVLYDTGPSDQLILHNVRTLGLDLGSLDAIVLSHGHWDHFGGLIAVLTATGKLGVPVYLHRRMFDRRRVVTKTEQEERIHEFPAICSIDDIADAGGNPIITTESILIAGQTILRTGEIPRNTDYERGFANHQALVDGEWMDDSEIIDDNCLAIRTRKGLIIITGCAHAGLINSINEAIRLTGTRKVHAIIGGFHLSGTHNEPRIKRTINDLKALNPQMIVPSHCTGVVAQHMIAKAFPEAYVTGSVGNLYRL